MGDTVGIGVHVGMGDRYAVDDTDLLTETEGVAERVEREEGDPLADALMEPDTEADLDSLAVDAAVAVADAVAVAVAVEAVPAKTAWATETDSATLFNDDITPAA
jgi:hypothetical protein